jgi:hypothetical protein
MRSDHRINPVLSALHAAAGIRACARKRGDERGTVSNYCYGELNFDWHIVCHSSVQLLVKVPCAD